jgi:hypothetical protein
MSGLNNIQESLCRQYKHRTVTREVCKLNLPRLPQDLRSRLPSWPDDRKKSIRFESSSSDGTLLRRRLRLPFGVTSETGKQAVKDLK